MGSSFKRRNRHEKIIVYMSLNQFVFRSTPNYLCLLSSKVSWLSWPAPLYSCSKTSFQLEEIILFTLFCSSSCNSLLRLITYKVDKRPITRADPWNMKNSRLSSNDNTQLSILWFSVPLLYLQEWIRMNPVKLHSSVSSVLCLELHLEQLVDSCSIHWSPLKPGIRSPLSCPLNRSIFVSFLKTVGPNL